MNANALFETTCPLTDGVEKEVTSLACAGHVCPHPHVLGEIDPSSAELSCIE